MPSSDHNDNIENTAKKDRHHQSPCSVTGAIARLSTGGAGGQIDRKEQHNSSNIQPTPRHPPPPSSSSSLNNNENIVGRRNTKGNLGSPSSSQFASPLETCRDRTHLPPSSRAVGGGHHLAAPVNTASSHLSDQEKGGGSQKNQEDLFRLLQKMSSSPSLEAVIGSKGDPREELTYNCDEEDEEAVSYMKKPQTAIAGGSQRHLADRRPQSVRNCRLPPPLVGLSRRVATASPMSQAIIENEEEEEDRFGTAGEPGSEAGTASRLNENDDKRKVREQLFGELRPLTGAQVDSSRSMKNTSGNVDVRSLWRIFGTSECNPWAARLKHWSALSHMKDAFVWLDKSGEVSVRLTYGRLAEEVWKISRFLRDKLGMCIGDRVVLCYPPSLEFLPAFFACVCSGIIAIPVYPPNPTRAKFDCARFHAICESAAVSHVLTDTMYNRVAKFLPTLARDSRWKRLSWWDSRAVIENKSTANEDGADVFNYDFPALSPDCVAFLQYTSGSTGQPKGVMVSSGGLLHNCHLCVGSFGFPSELDDPSISDSIDDVPVEQYEHWFHHIRQPVHLKHTGHPIRVFSWLPVYHDMGLIGFVLVPFLFGGSAYHLSPLSFIKKPHLWMECISKYGCVCSAGPNFAFELSVKKMPHEVYEKLDLSHVCGILCGAEPIRRVTVARFLNKFGPKGLRPWAFRPAYGCAENTLIVSGPLKFNTPVTFIQILADELRSKGHAVCTLVENVSQPSVTPDNLLSESSPGESSTTSSTSLKDDKMTLVSCGERKSGVDIRIVDTDTGRELPEGYAGEIWIKSPSLARGYFGCSEECRRAFDNSVHLADKSALDDGYFRSGDAGFFLHEQLLIVGRLKDIIILGERSYFPQDLEAEIDSVPGLRPGCSAAFALDVNGVERCALAVEIRDSVAKQGFGARLASLITGKQYDEAALENIKDEIEKRVMDKFDIPVAAMWLCRPKTLPKTSSGKVRRSVIREMLLHGVLDFGVISAPVIDEGVTVTHPANPRKVRTSLTAPTGGPPPRLPIDSSSTMRMRLLMRSSSPATSSVPRSSAQASPITGGANLLVSQNAAGNPASTSLFPHPAIEEDGETDIDDDDEVDVAAAGKPPLPSTKEQVPEFSPIPQSSDWIASQMRVAIEAACGFEDQCVPSMDELMDETLAGLGIDSIGALIFVEELSALLGFQVNSTLLFRRRISTLRDLHSVLCDQLSSNVKDRLDFREMVTPNGQTIAFRIVGVACRFPGSSQMMVVANSGGGAGISSNTTLCSYNRGFEDFWANLIEGRDSISEVPLDRWNNEALFCDRSDEDRLATGGVYTREAGFVQDLEYFDHKALKLSLREVEQMDPQQRLALECAVEAMVSGGGLLKDSSSNSSFAAATMSKNKKIGVYFGCYSSDWQKVGRGPLATSGWPSLVASRVSAVLGLTGPAIVIDSACSASLVALDLALAHLREYRCSAALVGGVNVMLAPDATATLCRMHLLAPDSRCKTFDARANGFSRGEGVGCLLVLNGNDTSRQDRLEPLALIRSVAVNHGGGGAIGPPNVSAQKEVISAALIKAGVRGGEVDFLECHGVGTKLGDPAELQAIQAVYCRNRSFETPLILGAVKTNIGHLEGAAGIAGVIKAIGVLMEQTVPMNLHLRELNPLLRTDWLPVVFPTNESYSLNREKNVCFAGVSSFGFGGTNAHAILERAAPDVANRRPPIARKMWRKRAFPWRELIYPMIGAFKESGVDKTVRGGDETTVLHHVARLRKDVAQCFGDHVVQGTPVVPLSAWLELLHEVFRTAKETTTPKGKLGERRNAEVKSSCHIETLEITAAVPILAQASDVTLSTTINSLTGQLVLAARCGAEFSPSVCVGTGELVWEKQQQDVLSEERGMSSTSCWAGIAEVVRRKYAANDDDDQSKDQFTCCYDGVTAYTALRGRMGIDERGNFRCLQRLWRARAGVRGSTAVFYGHLKSCKPQEAEKRQFERAFLSYPPVLEGIFQLCNIALNCCAESTTRPNDKSASSRILGLSYPVRLEGVAIRPFSLYEDLICRVTVGSSSGKYKQRPPVSAALYSLTRNKVIANFDKIAFRDDYVTRQPSLLTPPVYERLDIEDVEIENVEAAAVIYNPNVTQKNVRQKRTHWFLFYNRLIFAEMLQKYQQPKRAV